MAVALFGVSCLDLSRLRFFTTSVPLSGPPQAPYSLDTRREFHTSPCCALWTKVTTPKESSELPRRLRPTTKLNYGSSRSLRQRRLWKLISVLTERTSWTR